MELFLQLVISGLLVGSIYALVALGIVLIYKTSSIFNIAVGPLVALGTFVSWWFLVGVGLPLPLTIVGLILVAILCAKAIERLMMRPLIGQPILSAVMITIALLVIVSGIITLLWPGPIRAYPPILPSGVIELGNLTVSIQSLLGFLICLLGFALFAVIFQRTKMGLAMRAVAEDQQLAQSGGLKVNSIVGMAWSVAVITAFGGGVLLGSLHGVNIGAISALGFKAFPAVMIGGMESIPGALIGGLLVGLFESLGAGYLDPYVAGGMTDVAPFIILLLILVIKPYGLFGYARIERV